MLAAASDLLDLGQSFQRYFAIVPALTDELRRQAFRIRHQVYCEELGYEPVRANGLETDEYDAQSLHCLIRSLKTGTYVGCARLVLSRRADPLYPLPFERTCAGTLDRSTVDPGSLPRHSIAEVSRLAIVSAYRARRGERTMLAPLTAESFGTVSRPRFPYIIVGLYLGIIELAALHRIENLFVLTEPRLVRQLSRLGVTLTRIGAEVQHRGMRVPSVLRVSSIVAGLNFVVRPLYQVIAQQVREAFHGLEHGTQHTS
jgi:N-acyl amino acid synthase of PEP-CTERM/exosortase system